LRPRLKRKALGTQRAGPCGMLLSSLLIRSSQRKRALLEKSEMFRLDKVSVASAIIFLGTISLQAQESGDRSRTSQSDNTAQAMHMGDVPYSPQTKITVERRGQVVLIGINRPYMDNRLDPEATESLARAYYDYDQDPSLRAAVLFGYGERFSRGID